jgi:hypothetical protein
VCPSAHHTLHQILPPHVNVEITLIILREKPSKSVNSHLITSKPPHSKIHGIHCLEPTAWQFFVSSFNFMVVLWQCINYYGYRSCLTLLHMWNTHLLYLYLSFLLILYWISVISSQ